MYNLKDSKWKPGTPKNQAVRCYFQALDVENLDPYFLEKNFRKEIESESIAAIWRVIIIKNLPTGENFIWIINLMGLLASRNLDARKNNTSAEESSHLDIKNNISCF